MWLLSPPKPQPLIHVLWCKVSLKSLDRKEECYTLVQFVSMNGKIQILHDFLKFQIVRWCWLTMWEVRKEELIETLYKLLKQLMRKVG
jgi:hypothetical protein